MKRMLVWPCFALAVALSGPFSAGTKPVTLSVPGMNCSACPITVKMALGKVPGVAKTDVNLDKRQAAVTFDDARTNAEALMRATKDAGFPSTVVGSVQ